MQLKFSAYGRMRQLSQAQWPACRSTQRLAALPHASHGIVRRLHVARSSANGFVASAVALAEPSSSASGPEELKAQLRTELHGLDRGIFGVPAAKKARILSLIGELEQHNTHQSPTSNLSNVDGDWRLLFSTITITGAKRTKLGLREFVRLGEFTQHIDTANRLAINTIGFSVTGLGSLAGALVIRASYTVGSPSRVDITFSDSELTPSQLQSIFGSQLPLLLSIFNPEGHLDISYLDQQPEMGGAWRVGRDDKGNVFLLERPAGGGDGH